MKAPGRATALGRLLGTIPRLIVEGERRGAGLYRLIDADFDEVSPQR